MDKELDKIVDEQKKQQNNLTEQYVTGQIKQRDFEIQFSTLTEGHLKQLEQWFQDDLLKPITK